MKAVVILSKNFFPQHPKKGEETNFKELVKSGKKKHTCRSNYEYWKTKIVRLQTVGGALSLRQWSASPYRSPQEVIEDIPAELVGVQKLELRRTKVFNQHFEIGNKRPIAETVIYEWAAEVDGCNIPLPLLAENDGLSTEDYKAWFSPVFDKAEKKYPELAAMTASVTIDFSVIHFTKERY